MGFLAKKVGVYWGGWSGYPLTLMTKGASSVLVKAKNNNWTCFTPIKPKNHNNSINNEWFELLWQGYFVNTEINNDSGHNSK